MADNLMMVYVVTKERMGSPEIYAVLIYIFLP